MRNHSLRARLCALTIATLLPLIASSPLGAQQSATPSTFKDTYSIAQQYVDSQGRIVVILQGVGDLPGVLTLVLSAGADGTLTGGEWAMNVSYTAQLHPNAAPNPNDTDTDSAAGEQLIQKGTLSGSIASGSLAMTNGLVTSIAGLQLVIQHGSMQFASVTSGSGTVSATHLDDRLSSTAAATLTF